MSVRRRRREAAGRGRDEAVFGRAGVGLRHPTLAEGRARLLVTVIPKQPGVRWRGGEGLKAQRRVIGKAGEDPARGKGAVRPKAGPRRRRAGRLGAGRTARTAERRVEWKAPVGDGERGGRRAGLSPQTALAAPKLGHSGPPTTTLAQSGWR